MPQLIFLVIVIAIVVSLYQAVLFFIDYLRSIPYFGMLTFFFILCYLTLILYRHYQKVALQSRAVNAQRIIKDIKAIERK